MAASTVELTVAYSVAKLVAGKAEQWVAGRAAPSVDRRAQSMVGE